jgi:uncharacterized membrane protein
MFALPDVGWILVPIIGLLALLLGGAFLTGAFLEMASFVILAGILAIIFASRDILIISIALLLIAKKVLSRRPVTHEYDVDSAAWGLR